MRAILVLCAALVVLPPAAAQEIELSQGNPFVGSAEHHPNTLPAAMRLLAEQWEILQGRDRALDRLSREIAQLTEMLSLEEAEKVELESTLSQLTVHLGALTTARDRLEAEVSEALTERDRVSERLKEALETLEAKRAIPPVSCKDDWISFVVIDHGFVKTVILTRRKDIVRGAWTVHPAEDGVDRAETTTAEVVVHTDGASKDFTVYRVRADVFSGIIECMMEGPEAPSWGTRIVDALRSY